MYFHWGDSERILFKTWVTGGGSGSTAYFVLSCVAFFILSMLLEILSNVLTCLRQSPTRKHSMKTNDQVTEAHQEMTHMLDKNEASSVEAKAAPKNVRQFDFDCKGSATLGVRLISSLVFALRLLLAYVLMLVVMTFNMWFFLSILFGNFFGYWLFGYEIQRKEK